MEILKELEQRVATLELHREYDVKLNEEQTKKLDKAAREISEIYVGLKWMIRIGKFLTAVSALFISWAVFLKGGH